VCVLESERERERRKEEGKERKEERIEEHISFNFDCVKASLIRKEDV
jgi:hypothetical protein